MGEKGKTTIENLLRSEKMCEVAGFNPVDR